MTTVETIQQGKVNEENEMSMSEAAAKWAPTGDPGML